jgi:Contractile injection system tape measure protein
MATKRHHIIEKQVLEITLPDFTTALHWEANQRGELKDAIYHVLDRCFEEYDNEENHLVIEKLELDLGTFTEESFQTEMPRRLFAELQKKMPGHWESAAKKTNNLYSGFIDKEDERGSKRHLFSAEQSLMQSFFFFCQRGYLPWWAASVAEWNLAWLQKLTKEEWISVREFFLSSDHASLLRLTQQFGDDFLAVFTEGVGGMKKSYTPLKWILQLIDHWEEKYIALAKNAFNNLTYLSRAALKPVSVPLIRQRYWSKCIRHSLGYDELPQLKELFWDNEAMLDFIKISVQNMMPEYSLSLRDVPLMWKAEMDELISSKEKQYRDAPATVNESTEIDRQPAAIRNESTESRTNISSATEDDEVRLVYKKATNKISSEDKAENLFITGAGLVLLHPFLPHLFRHCDFLDEKIFRDAESQTKAVYAIHYLITGTVIMPEHQLLLPKLFCGMSLEQPLHPVDLLAKSQQEAGDELLRAVIRHWTALKNTSPDGLREAFLQRNGKLEIRDGDWHLLVEEKTQDILIKRLPWGISIVKYPWMKGMLSVTWNSTY